MVEKSKWTIKIEQDPGHSQWYIERFHTMAAEGKDLAGEARFVDAMVERHARILDAGCGPGRVGGFLHDLGHTVVGVDVDPALIEAAERDHPGPTWLLGDLAELDLAAHGITELFDVILAAGQVMTFLAPSTRVEVLTRLRNHLGPQGRLVVGFGAGRDYDFDDFWADCATAGLKRSVDLESWDLRPFTPESSFLVAVLVAD